MRDGGLSTVAAVGLFGLQASVALAGLAALAFAPPATGRMILVPLTADAAAGLAAVAIDHGALLVGAGPMPGSLIVEGQRAQLFGATLERGSVALAAPMALCGNLAGRGGRK